MLSDVAKYFKNRGGRFRWIWIAIAFYLSIFSISCNSVAPVVKIGLVGPFEGRHREIGYDVIYSARLAIRQANKSGGIGDYRVSLVALDDFGDPEMASQTAAAMIADENIVVVLGHWLPETTDSANPVYERAGLPFVATNTDEFSPFDPSLLPNEFLQEYAEVTPFDEVAGPFAGSAYDVMNAIFEAIRLAEEGEGEVNRDTVGRALQEIQYEGMTGIFGFSG